MQIPGALAVVTGASSGIGAATALALACAGARVILLARTRSALESVAATIHAHHGEATAYAVDLTDPDAVEHIAEQIRNSQGVPDILVSNAGSGRWLFVDETSPAEAVAMMAMPYFAAFYLTRAFLPAMQERPRGHLVYVNSPAAIVPWPGATAYTAARWALLGFTEALRADLYSARIGVTTVIPGLVATDYFRNNPGVKERIPGLARLLPMIPPERVAAAIVRGIRHNHPLVIEPGILRVMYGLYRVWPAPIRWLAAVTGARQ